VEGGMGAILTQIDKDGNFHSIFNQLYFKTAKQA
jgi:hypothetical protein